MYSDSFIQLNWKLFKNYYQQKRKHNEKEERTFVFHFVQFRHSVCRLFSIRVIYFRCECLFSVICLLFFTLFMFTNETHLQLEHQLWTFKRKKMCFKHFRLAYYAFIIGTAHTFSRYEYFIYIVIVNCFEFSKYFLSFIMSWEYQIFRFFFVLLTFALADAVTRYDMTTTREGNTSTLFKMPDEFFFPFCFSIVYDQ